MMSKKTAEERELLQASLPQKLVYRVKSEALRRNVTMRQAVSQAMENWLVPGISVEERMKSIESVMGDILKELKDKSIRF